MLAGACLPVWSLLSCSPRTPAMTAEESQYVQKLTSRMRTRCIGRHLIDLPEAFELNPVDRVEIEGVEVSIRPLSQAWFEHRLERRTQELKNEVIDVIRKEPVLMDMRAVPEGIGRVFNRADGYAFARIWELMAWRDGFYIHMEVDAVDMSKTERLGKDDTLRTDVEEKYTHLLNVYRRLRGRREEEIPSEPGDCFAHGFWMGAQAEAAEFSVNYHLMGAPDVYINLFSVSGDEGVARPETGLMQRRKDIERQTRMAGIKLLRFAPRTIGGHAYEESIGREPAEVSSARVAGHTAIIESVRNFVCEA
ncbi:MAG: hypothetical protein KatS3mg122_1653 [Caldimonas sp.]|jgi:hypothetical protein|nr:MAG: hypothetical protein KatS3mg122_1653 [Caldimonas sp.]